MPHETNNLVVVSDLHCGCRLGLCPGRIRLDDGGHYEASPFQLKLLAMWREFWDSFVPEATKGEPYAVLINGDAVDGRHHGSTTQVSQNLSDQANIAAEILEPIAARADALYWVRGTEAHVGSSGEQEEALAQRLRAIPNETGQHARWELWRRVGPRLVHSLHHIGTTSAQAYESTAVHRELIESFVEAARWKEDPPDCIVRSHRHRHFETSMSTAGRGEITSRAIAVITPGWQGKTPFVYRIAGGRLSPPQFGGIVIRYAHDELFVRAKVWTVQRSGVE